MLSETEGWREQYLGGAGEVAVSMFLPNCDLISEPEYTVRKDTTRHGAAHFLSW